MGSDDDSDASCPDFLPQNLDQTLQPEEIKDKRFQFRLNSGNQTDNPKEGKQTESVRGMNRIKIFQNRFYLFLSVVTVSICFYLSSQFLSVSICRHSFYLFLPVVTVSTCSHSFYLFLSVVTVSICFYL